MSSKHFPTDRGGKTKSVNTKHGTEGQGNIVKQLSMYTILIVPTNQTKMYIIKRQFPIQTTLLVLKLVHG